MRRIFADLARGVTLRALSASLTAEGVGTPSGRAQFWHPSTVRWVATNPAYTGEAVAWRFTVRKDRQRGTESVVLRPEGEQVALPAGTIPPLVDADTFLAVQERLRLNKAHAARNNRSPHATLLRAGYARCGYCGRALSAERNPQGVVYTCGGGRTAEGRCNHGMFAHLLDAAVWARVEAVLTEPETVARQLAAAQTDDPTADDRAAVARALAGVARQQGNLGRALALVDDDDAAPLLAELKVLGARKRQLEQEQGTLARRHEGWASASAQLDTLTAWCAMVAANLRDFTYEEKRFALEALGVEVRLWRKGHEPRYEITARIPLDGKIVNRTSLSSTSPRRSPAPASARSASTRAIDQFTALNAKVVGVSTDQVPTLLKFAAQCEAAGKVTLLSDFRHRAVQSYGIAIDSGPTPTSAPSSSSTARAPCATPTSSHPPASSRALAPNWRRCSRSRRAEHGNDE